MSIDIKLSNPKLPVVPQTDGQRAHDAVKETIETMRGTRGNLLDRAIFVRDLQELGILDVNGGRVAVGNVVKNPSGIGNDLGGDFGEVPALENLVATAGFSSVLLTWNDPHYKNLAYYEVWRKTVTTVFDEADTNNIPAAQLFITESERTELAYYAGLANPTANDIAMRDALVALYDATAHYVDGVDATLLTLRQARINLTAAYANDLNGAIRVGTTVAPIFSDPVDKGTTYIYWVRAVSKSGAYGPYTNPGLVVTTQPDIGRILRDLTDEVYQTQISQFIFNGINIEDFDAVFGDSASVAGALVQQAGWISELQAGWGVRVEQTVNGTKYISGFGLNSEIAENGGFSTFLVAANRFAVIDPAQQEAVAPFIIDAGKTYINHAMIKKAAIMELIAGSVIADYVRIGTGLVSSRINTSTINIGTWVLTNPNDPTSWVYDASAGRQGYFSVDQNGWMWATYALLKGIVVTDMNNQIVLDTVNNTYQTALVSKNNPINASNIGTFISHLAVGSLHIQGNAVTTPCAATWAGNLALSSAYTPIVGNMWVGVNPVTGLASVDNDIPVAIFWAAECTADNTNAKPRRFRIRKSSFTAEGNVVVYESFAEGRNTDQFNSGVVMTKINAGVLYFISLEAMGSGTVYQGSLFAVVTRR